MVESLEDRRLLAAPTLMSLSDSASGLSTYGQNVTFTAAVTSNGSPVSEGTVDFSTGGVILARSIPVDSSGNARFNTTRFPAFYFTITATYNDTLQNYFSSSGTDNLSVTRAPLTISAPNQSMVYGGTIPTLLGPNYSGFVNGDSAAILTSPVTSLTAATASSPVGSYDITLSDPVAPNYTITFVKGTFTITPDSTATALVTSAAAVSFGQPVNLSASVAPLVSATATETGSVALYDGTTPLATVPLGSGGVAGSAVFTTSNLSLGVHTLTATYRGDANHTGSTSAAVIVTVRTPSEAASGVISGTVFHDYNSNGAQDPGEPSSAWQTLFLDVDGSGQLKAGDPTAITDANGNFQLAAPSAGTYTVRQLLLGGVLLSAPANDSYQVALTSGATVSGQNFADVLTSIAVPLTLTPSTPFPAQGNANADYVEAVYRAVLNRNADSGGLANWTGQLNSGALSRLQVVQGIRNSPEHFTQEVSDFYLTLLNRQADPSGLQNWVQQLEGGMREEKMAFYFLDSPE